MGADETTGAGQAPGAGQPQAGTGTPPQAGGDESGTGTGGKLSLEELQAELSKVRKEAAGHRLRASQLEKAQQDADAAKLSESERVARERDTLKAELEAERLDRRSAINRYEVQLKAAGLGIVDPEAAVKLLDWDSIEYGEDGSPKNVDAALGRLLKTKPYLAAAPGRPTSVTNPARSAPAEEKIWTQAEIADPAVWAKNREAITQAMREGRVR